MLFLILPGSDAFSFVISKIHFPLQRQESYFTFTIYSSAADERLSTKVPFSYKFLIESFPIFVFADIWFYSLLDLNSINGEVCTYRRSRYVR